MADPANPSAPAAPVADARPASFVAPSESLVAVCDARDCRYNRDGACAAGAVSIAFLRGAPVCATYSPETSAASPTVAPDMNVRV